MLILSLSIQLLCNYVVVKKNQSLASGPRRNMITNLLCQHRMTHLVHEKVCIEGIIFAGFHRLKGKKLFDFVSLPIVLFLMHQIL